MPTLQPWHAANFYPRYPCGERRRSRHLVHLSALFLSTLSLRRATISKSIHPTCRQLFLSTLSLRRATVALAAEVHLKGNFYPRSPCGERHKRPRDCNQLLYFYPRSPCGVRPFSATRISRRWSISIHALLAESDLDPFVQFGRFQHFYPRSPCGERRYCMVSLRWCLKLFLSTLSLRRATPFVFRCI